MKIYSDVFNFQWCHSNVLKNAIQIHTEERYPLLTSEKKGYKIDYKSFSVVKNCKNLIDGENLTEEKRTKNCVHGLLHERADVKKIPWKILVKEFNTSKERIKKTWKNAIYFQTFKKIKITIIWFFF